MASLVLLVGSALVIGWIAPDLAARLKPAPHDEAALEVVSEAGLSQSAREAWLTGAHVLERADDGHFYAEAQVDGRATRFLVDTGASIVALTAADAEAIGLDWREEDVVPIGRGASGMVGGVPVRLARLELGGFEAEGVDAAIIPDGLGVSLLGQSFLSRLDGVRIEGDRMVLGESQ